MTTNTERLICLDLGCGSGRGYAFNPHCPTHTETILLDVECPESWVRRLVSARASLHFIVADMCKLPIRDNVADVGYAIHSLEHVTSLEWALRELYRVFKPGASIHIEFPTILSKDCYRDPTHRQRLHLVLVWRLAKTHGFQVRFKYSAGSLIPEFIRKYLTFMLNLLINHMHIILKPRKTSERFSRSHK